MLTLDVAIVTHRPEGIAGVAAMRLPREDGVRYVVSWQNHMDAPVPEALLRPDIEVVRFEGKGIAANRNNAIDHCRAGIVLFADDDISFLPGAFDSVRRVYEEHPELDVATFRSEHGDMSRFPDSETDLTKGYPSGYSVSSIELTFRNTAECGLRCCPELGIGTPIYHGGEDELFLLTAVRRGMQCRFFPVTICSHPAQSTGDAYAKPGNLRASGVVIALTYPLTAFLRVPLKAWRLWRSGRAPFIKALRYISAGAIAAPALRRRNRKYLW